jgi:hypothetical protein
MTKRKLVLAITTCIVSVLLLFSPYLGYSGILNSGLPARNLNNASEIATVAPSNDYKVNSAGATRVGFYPTTMSKDTLIPLMPAYCRGWNCGGNSSITINSAYSSGVPLNGTEVKLEQDGWVLATGFTPVTFIVRASETYSISAEDYPGAFFFQWSNGVCSSPDTVNVGFISSNIVLTAVYDTRPAPLSSCVDPSGITVYAARIPASYWAACFALNCTAGTGPGASMGVVLSDSSGNIIATAFTNENGYTFTGLTPGTTYFIYPADCDLCHGSTHDVIFEYWNNNTSTVRPLAVEVGVSLTAWYSCTNGCGGV